MSGFEKLDISSLRRKMAKEESIERSERAALDQTPTVKKQRARTATKPAVGRQDGFIEFDDGYRLHGTLLEDDMWLEMYTDRANGWVRGQVFISEHGPCLKVAVRDRRAGKEGDGKPPLLGYFTGPIVDGAICRFSLVKR